MAFIYFETCASVSLSGFQLQKTIILVQSIGICNEFFQIKGDSICTFLDCQLCIAA